ncbi:DUF6519 domain-containing protein [Schlesneria paludicola]|uniref:DUF6519 domain-containing protein n=1 Tax=Schlesneria paludicola TaxID=360056 RepID=UPI00029A8475|nr:DUF6519 domain-containing protein [Schlesneria paludicola]
MSHDITRDSHLLNEGKNYAKVRRLQGRIFTDADFNEQVDLADRRVRDLIVDVVGYHAGAILPGGVAVGFKITEKLSQNKINDLTIGVGTYYVDGIRVTNDANPQSLPTYSSQWPNVPSKPFPVIDKFLLAYLDVQNVPVTPLDDSDLLDVGFEGRDSCNREKWDWVVRVARLNSNPGELSSINDLKQDTLANPAEIPYGETLGQLTFSYSTRDSDHCVSPAMDAFSGISDQLYRVEVHEKGILAEALSEKAAPRLKWSRDNAAPAFAIKPNGWSKEADAATWRVALESLDALGGSRSLEALHWVEPVLPDWYHRDVCFPLLWVESIDPENLEAIVALGPDRPKISEKTPIGDPLIDAYNALKALEGIQPIGKAKPRLILWDHLAGDFRGLKLSGKDGDTNDPGIQLEHGLQAQLKLGAKSSPRCYRVGDYWQHVVRTAEVRVPSSFRDPDGPEHLFAPLAVFSDTALVKDWRRKINSIGAPV